MQKKKKNCPYYFTDTSEEVLQFMRENNIENSDFNKGCDFDQISFDAADMLEGTYETEE